MKCTFCGEEIPVGAKFCPNCGTPSSSSQEGSRETSQDIFETPSEEREVRQEETNNSYTYGGYEDSTQMKQEESASMYEDPNKYVYGQTGTEAKDYSFDQQYTYDNNSYEQQNTSNQQASYDQQPQFQQYQNTTQGKTISGTPYIIFSILTTLCCCLPLGIVSIVYASKIDALSRQGDYEGAHNAAKKSRLFCIIGAVGGLISSVALGLFSTVGIFSDNDIKNMTESIINESTLDDEHEAEKSDVKKEKVTESGDLGESWNSFSVQINDHVLTFPCSVSDVEAIGLEEEDDDVDDDAVISAGDYELVFFEDEQDNYLMFMVCNNTESDQQVRDCTVNGIYLSDVNIENGGITVILPGGIQIGSDISTALEKWGDPASKYESDGTDSYTWNDDNYNYCTLSVDHESGKITTMDLDGSGL